MVETLSVNKERMEHVLTTDFSNATELADYLAKNGVPFRQAHAIAGKLVLHQIISRIKGLISSAIIFEFSARPNKKKG